MMNGALKITLAASLMAGLAACGNDDRGIGALGTLAQTAAQVVAERRAPDQPAAPAKSPEEAAAEALRINSGPLIQAGFENLNRTQIMAMTGQNGAMRTYMTPAEEAVILRNGMLVGTKGLGNDLSVADPGVTVENCEGHGTSFQNSYMVQGGQIAVSRQWIGPALGYVTIQTLRP
jgi:hypothetical protein